MGVLFAKARKALPSSDFAGKGRSYPIPDESHARAALSMAHYHPSEAPQIRAKVAAKFPGINVGGMKPRAAALVSKLRG